MGKEININGCIVTKEDITEEQFFDEFIEFIESKGWQFGGGISITDVCSDEGSDEN